MQIRTGITLFILVILAFYMDLMRCKDNQLETFEGAETFVEQVKITFEPSCMMSNFSEILFYEEGEDYETPLIEETMYKREPLVHYFYELWEGEEYIIEARTIFGDTIKNAVGWVSDTEILFEDMIGLFYPNSYDNTLINVETEEPVTVFFEHLDGCEESGSVYVVRDTLDSQKMHIYYSDNSDENGFSSSIQHYIVSSRFLLDLLLLEVGLDLQVNEDSISEKITIIANNQYYTYSKDTKDGAYSFKKKIDNLLEKHLLEKENE